MSIGQGEAGWTAKLSLNKLANLLKAKPSQQSRLLLEALQDKADLEKKKSARTKKDDWISFARNSTLNGGKAAHRYMNNLGMWATTRLSR